VLITNKSSSTSYDIRLTFKNATGKHFTYRSPADVYQYSQKQYRWSAHEDHGYAKPNLPPSHRVMDVDKARTISLPPYSITVVSGGIR
jgi:hypothetical protein